MASNSAMPLQFNYDPTYQLCEIQLAGTLSHDELLAGQARLAPLIEAGAEPRVLVVVGDFGGWQSVGDWNNLDFMFSHGSKISKIAFVGDKKWEDELKMFVGAGFRSAPVGYFESGREDVAKAWLLG